jgi:tetratricopeptide (TPR) repeat protein
MTARAHCRLALALLLAIGAEHGAGAADYGSPAAARPAADAQPTASQPVSAEVSAALHHAQDEADPFKALAILDAYQGPAHPLITLMRGQLHLALADRGTDQQAHRTEAERAFSAVVDQEACRHNAHIGLAQIAGARGDWKSAEDHCAQALSVERASSGELEFYAQVATRAQDWRLASTLAQLGMMRYPASTTFRQLEVVVLLQSERCDEARQALLALLASEPADASHWRQVAWCDRTLKRDDEALAALELASLSALGDVPSARALAEAQLGANLPLVALATVRPLIGEPARKEALSDPRLIELGVRAAQAAGEIALGRSWLEAVPPAERTRSQQLLAARLAVQAGDTAAAAMALAALIAAGERDGAVLVWAGHLAEQGKDDARAETFYAQAATGDGAAAGNATLRLGSLYYRQQRWDEASTLVSTYLARHPDDHEAKRLLDLIERGRPSLKR